PPGSSLSLVSIDAPSRAHSHLLCVCPPPPLISALSLHDALPIFFLRICEYSQPFKPAFFYKFHQSLVLFFCLSRESADQSCTDCNIGHSLPQFPDNFQQIFPAGTAAHSLKNTMFTVLNRYVNVMKDFFFCFHYIDQFIRNFLRVTVQKPDPFNSFNPAQFPKQCRQFFFPCPVFSV